jgi:ABC-type dipeptide/oligopeptide/nickel transport system ATPase component
MDPRLEACFFLQISGPSGSGKTVWVKKFLENIDKMIDRKVDQILYYYGEWQLIFDEIRQNIPQIQFFEGFPDVKSMTDPSFHTVMTIDDLQNELLDNL